MQIKNRQTTMLGKIKYNPKSKMQKEQEKVSARLSN